MKNINKGSLLFFVFSVIFFTYLTSGLLIFFLNGYFNLNLFKLINNNYDLLFTYKAIINNYPRIWEAIFYSASFYSVVFFILILLPNKKSLHGEARFANRNEIKKMGLFQDKGLVVGKLESGELLKWKSSEFLALGAPTRSGKGVGIVIPNLMEWEESCVVLDIKQECFDFSSKYRRDILGQEVYLFNPFDFRTHRYNPLTYIDLENETTRDNDLLDFVNLLYPADGDSTTVFFNQLAQNLFIGLAYLYKDLALTKNGREFLEEHNLNVEWSMCGLLNLSAGFDLSIPSEEEEDTKITGLDDTFEYLEHLEIISKPTKEKLNSYFTIDSQNTKSGVMSSFNAPLMIYRNQPITTATATSDFDLRDLRKKRMTIFIGITPDKLAIARPILNIFFSQLLSVNTKELPQKNPDLKYTCLLLLDEFTSIGNMPILKKGVSYIASFHLRILMIFQAISQLEARTPDGYDKEGANTLLQNMGVKIYYTPNEFEEAEKISKRLGDTTFKAISKSYNHGKFLEAGSSSHSVSEQKRALMLPQELMELSQSKALLMMNYQKPILCNKAFYYNDEYFINKFRQVSPFMKSIKNPNHKDWEKMLQLNETNIEIPIQTLNNNS
ncbi:type IV secretory system conjugative DNA transfer family protein [Arcobacter defluvii]|uniref:P-type type IV conjugative transfer system coupling protein TraG/VirD4 n=1 Tax=Arcobacter defluvii TaxID=873191 RepID=A0AAE7BDV5_9BACT|nr:type IV secretory system conjugative DNA transfer family protein [Arcobacter defluvii]QKF77293.1 P-type type IV conjugative transfer system coupling protein TraG/VirD4 [Arcobacter defluvii]QKF77863.1 P-type type IV conjugative transfer system coupling protein TraG/VirD4 [Arcobacter defluvii]RXI29654.1 sodium:calcium antiporter [Arcobacter defluvii]